MATIRKKSAGTYQLIVYTRYTEDGKQKRIYRTWTAPEGLTPKAAEKAAQRAADDLETQILHGRDPKRIRMDAFARKWLDEYAEPNLAPKTVSGYRDMMPRVVNAFGCLYLDEIGSKNLSDFYADLRKTPCATHYCSDGGLSALMESQGVSKNQTVPHCKCKRSGRHVSHARAEHFQAQRQENSGCTQSFSKQNFPPLQRGFLLVWHHRTALSPDDILNADHCCILELSARKSRKAHTEPAKGKNQAQIP